MRGGALRRLPRLRGAHGRVLPRGHPADLPVLALRQPGPHRAARPRGRGRAAPAREGRDRGARLVPLAHVRAAHDVLGGRRVCAAPRADGRPEPRRRAREPRPARDLLLRRARGDDPGPALPALRRPLRQRRRRALRLEHPRGHLPLDDARRALPPCMRCGRARRAAPRAGLRLRARALRVRPPARGRRARRRRRRRRGGRGRRRGGGARRRRDALRPRRAARRVEAAPEAQEVRAAANVPARPQRGGVLLRRRRRRPRRRGAVGLGRPRLQQRRTLGHLRRGRPGEAAVGAEGPAPRTFFVTSR
mmetsp:Transcript_14376/g.49545  ORF Transcript_14376/g.49545 Transcript_14376/m.49545 type:complete len:305 (-) Transcript_14376:26-940(-)